MRPTYRCRNKDGTVPRGAAVALDGWAYFYDVGDGELTELRKHWDVVEIAKDRMEGGTPAT